MKLTNELFFDNGILNKNKLRESWMRKNLSNQYNEIVQFLNDYNLRFNKFSQSVWHFINSDKEIKICNCCHQNQSRFLGFQNGYNNFCSKSCAAKFGRPQIEIRKKENSLRKWGVSHTSKLQSTKDKQRKTNLEKYGFVSPSLAISVQNKFKLTNIDRYGVNYPSQNKTIFNKMMASRIDKYQNKIINDFPQLNFLSIKEGEFEILCDRCNKSYIIRSGLLRLRVNRYKIEPCLNCNPHKSYKYSSQKEILEFIKSLGIINIVLNDRKILSGKEIDIFLPDYNLAIEFNGLYWHSDFHKNKNYHLHKKEIAESLGIKLIHIWEDNWTYREDIIKSMIMNLLNLNNSKIYARNCKIRTIDPKEARKFVNDNHLQGYINSSVNLGLFYKDQLVSALTFGKYRRSLGKNHTESEWELYRFCSILNTTIIGSFSKMIKYFIDNYSPKKILTYAMYDWSNIGLTIYDKLQFTYVGKSPPNYWYFSSDLIRKHRFAFRKDKLIRDGNDPNKTEYEIMIDNGYYRMWDCGNLKYELNF